MYRAVDSAGNTLDFLLTAKRDAPAAERFFRKTLNATHTQTPRVINVDKNAAYPKAALTLTEDETLPKTVELRQNKYLNNRIEQDHRFIKRLVNPGMGFGSFNTADANNKRLWSDEHEPQGTSSGSGQRRCSSSDRIRALKFSEWWLNQSNLRGKLCPSKVFATQPLTLLYWI